MKHKIRFSVKIKDKDLKLRLIIRVKFLNQGSGAPTKYNGQDQSQWSQSELKNTTRFMGHITKHWGLNFSINTLFTFGWVELLKSWPCYLLLGNWGPREICIQVTRINVKDINWYEKKIKKKSIFNIQDVNCFFISLIYRLNLIFVMTFWCQTVFLYYFPKRSEF